MPATIWIQFERDPLPDKDMVTDAGGEPINIPGDTYSVAWPRNPGQIGNLRRYRNKEARKILFLPDRYSKENSFVSR